MMKTNVTFPEAAENPGYSTIVAMWRGKWIFVRQKKLDTWECPGGRIEKGESPLDAAKRELAEETGAVDFTMWEIGPFRVGKEGWESDGVLFFASVRRFDELPAYEIGELLFLDFLPDVLSIQLTYPDIQPVLFARAQAWLEERTTTVTFIRHAQSDHSVRRDDIRPLTKKGLADSGALPGMRDGLPLDAIYSSPYKRAVDTVTPLAEERGLKVVEVYNFRERASGEWRDDFEDYFRKMWADLDDVQEGGESLRSTMIRNISALEKILENERGKSVAIGTHGTSLSTILHHYMPEFGFDDSWGFRDITPYIVRLEFLDKEFLGIEEIKLNGDGEI